MRKIKYLKITFLVFSLLSCITYAFVYESNENEGEVLVSLRNYLLNSFISELPEINKKLPQKIDEETLLISIQNDNGQVLTVYQLDNIKAGDATNAKLINKAKPFLEKKGCLDDIKKKLLDVDVNFLERYQDSEGRIIFEFLLTRTKCADISSFK